MTNYTKTTNFASKDTLPSGNANKIVKGTEIDTEFNNIATALATKADTAGPTLTGTTTFETLSDGTISITAFVDEDNMASDSATLLPTQQSVKAYVDSQVTAQDLDFQADTGGALSIDLDSETLTLTGGTGIDTSGALNAVTFAIDATVATLTGTQTLSNKTLATPVVSGNLTTDGLVDGRDVATDGTKLDGIESGATADQTAAEIKTAYESNADTNAFTDADHSKLDGIEASADVTDATNVTAAGALMDSEVTNLAQVKAFDSSDYATASQGTTADAALPRTGGAMTGAITTNSTFDGRDVATDGAKLDGIEASADVTDTANVTAAGALMDSELTDIAAVKALNQGVATTDSPTFAGLTTTANISFGDNDKAIFGAGSDLEIYHNGSNSIITETGTGNLYLGGDNLLLTNGSLSAAYLEAITGGAVNIYHNGLQKLATTSTGIDVTGTVTADDSLTVDGTSPKIFLSETDTTDLNSRIRSAAGKLQIQTVDNSDSNPVTRFQIDHSTGDISFYNSAGTSQSLFWDSSAESLGVGTTSPNESLHVYNATANVLANFESGDAKAFISFKDNSTTDTDTVFLGADGNNMAFYAGSAGTERMRIDSSGNLLVGVTSATGQGHSFKNSSGMETYRNSATAGNTAFRVYSDVTSTATVHCSIYNDGDIENTNGSYGTLSDIRIKSNIEPAKSQWDDVKAAKLYNFDKEKCENRQLGWIAQELEEADMGGVVKTVESERFEDGIRSVKESVLLKKAFGALQEAMERIETLEAKVQQLENN